MNDYFYYFGLLYIVHLFKQMYDSIKAEKMGEEVIINDLIPKDINDMGKLSESFDEAIKIKKKIKYSVTDFIIDSVFIMWILAGYATTKSPWFLADIITIIAFFVLPIFALLITLFQKSKPTIQPKYKINVGLLQYTIEFIIVSYILYYHFFC